MKKVIAEREVFKTSIFTIKEIDLKLKNGKKVTFSLVEKKDSSLIVPITEDGKLILIKEYFAAIDDCQLSLPKGRVDSGNPLEAANRELQEEIGYKSGELIRLGTLIVSPGNTRHKTHVYLARKLVKSKLPGDEDEEIELLKIPFDNFEKFIDKKQLTEARVIASLYLARRYMKSRRKVLK
ncbi:MAG: NUDIX domain-containing protein [Candidatus Aenigmarchaeota archaeon]|nr:NUDIX domain-containing protein [Candidatus Aenigmarchaeota archaeon]